jgi:hypothetical protein
MPSGIYIRTDETKEKIRISKLGDKNPAKRDDVKNKISKAHKGKKLSEEHKNNISKSLNTSEKFQKAIHSEERALKISKKLTGKHHSEETKQKLCIANKGKIVSEETKQKMRDNAKNNPNYGMRGKHFSEESKKRISQSEKGKIISEDTRKLMSNSFKKRKERDGYINSPEAREKIRLSKLGKKRNPETKQKIREAKIGKKHSEETKLKIRESKLKNIMIDGQWYSIGNNETKLLNEQEIKDNCKINRNFICIGYHPDGYCHETNTIYEVYEKAHSKNIKQDLIRQQRLQEKLKCNFIIIYDNWNNNKIEIFNFIQAEQFKTP